MYVSVSGEDGVEEKVEVTKDIIDYFNPDERLMNYFDQQNRSFAINMKNGEKFTIYFPSLGTMQFIKNYIKNKQQSQQTFDKAFIKYAQYYDHETE
jgi:hypothetical protein